MLTDFGLSKDGILDHYSTHSFCGSLAYLAPEMLKRCGHGKGVDYYHLGVLLYEMLTGTPPFFSDQKYVVNNNVNDLIYKQTNKGKKSVTTLNFKTSDSLVTYQIKQGISSLE